MYLKNLLAAVDTLEEMPIEIEELAAKLVEVGCQDDIIFHPDPEMNPSVLRGIHYKYSRHAGVYSEPIFTTLIIYSERLPLEWQRVVCCKELIHTCDDPVERTNREDEVQGLLDKLLGPLSTENFGVADIMAHKDKLALYQALMILFPDNARNQALVGIRDRGDTPEKVARWMGLPIDLVKLVLDEDWPLLRETLANF